MQFSVFELPTLKMFSICACFLPISISLFLQSLYYGSYSGTQFLYKHGNIITQEIPSLFSVSKISFIFLMTHIDSSNDQNICVELFKATFTH